MYIFDINRKYNKNDDDSYYEMLRYFTALISLFIYILNLIDLIKRDLLKKNNTGKIISEGQYVNESKREKGKIILSEKFCISEKDSNIPVNNINITEDSKLRGNVKVFVLNCNPIINKRTQNLSVDLILLIEEKLRIIQASGRELPLEFNYRLKKNLPLEQQYDILAEDINHINCQAAVLSLDSNLLLNLSGADKTNAGIDENLDIYINVKVIME